jgi:hypothetical protein
MIFGKLYKTHRAPDIYLHIDTETKELVRVEGTNFFIPICLIKTDKRVFIKILCTNGNLYYKVYGGADMTKSLEDIFIFAKKYFDYYFIPHDEEE